jgi:mRNA interferase MazF
LVSRYVPARNDLVWLDFEPPRGKEIGKYRPALVLSSESHNRKTGLLICCPVSSSIRGAVTEVPVNNLEKPCVAVANLVHTLSWRDRKALLIAAAEEGVLEQVLLRLIPLIGADRVLDRYIEP